ncbi:MAG: hypothetical protein WC769_02750 [Thermodesulfovibrionales bacterium]|jgi:hypothetical protein
MTIKNIQYRGEKPWIRTSVRNEKGIALVMVLILAAIALLIMAALLYMITSSTQISGMQKRYKTALDAGFGGANIAYQFIAFRGDLTDTSSFQTLLSSINPVITTPSGCAGTDDSGTNYTGLSAKLMTPTFRNGVRIWSADCDSSMSIIPGTTTSYDMRYELPGNPTNYTVYAKIVDTVEGNSPADKGLGGEGVVVSGGGVVTVMKMPYLYTIEMDAQAVTNPSERAKLSILYQY